MIESRCGTLCSRCEFRESTGCTGCVNIEKPFWGENCPVKDCCEEKGHAHCGQCGEFPCQLANEFAYDPEHGDGGVRLAQCRKWKGEA